MCRCVCVNEPLQQTKLFFGFTVLVKFSWTLKRETVKEHLLILRTRRDNRKMVRNRSRICQSLLQPLNIYLPVQFVTWRSLPVQRFRPLFMHDLLLHWHVFGRVSMTLDDLSAWSHDLQGDHGDQPSIKKNICIKSFQLKRMDFMMK